MYVLIYSGSNVHHYFFFGIVFFSHCRGDLFKSSLHFLYHNVIMMYVCLCCITLFITSCICSIERARSCLHKSVKSRTMSSIGSHSFSALDEAYKLLRAQFSALMEVIRPEEICDDLYSAEILNDDVLEFVSNEDKPIKARNRKLLHTAFQKIRGNHERFENFIKTLEKTELAKELCAKIRGQFINRAPPFLPAIHAS